ncbi:hypothetical protein BAE44_0017233, partial [Dichanthelium oligosanthes]
MAAPAPIRRSKRLALRAASSARSNDRDHHWRDWAGLPLMMDVVADRVLDGDVMDFVQFRAVCKLWRVIDHRFHSRRWILLPPPAAAGGTRRRLLNVTTRKLAEADQPEFAGHVVVAGSAAAPEGMLVLRDERTLVVRLLNPVNRHVVDLPSVRTLQRGSRRGPISRAFREEHE